MKKLLLLILFALICVIETNAQDTRYVGTWKWHYDSPYEDGQEGIPPRDEYIRIDIEDGQIFVRLKMIGKDGYGRPFQSRNEGENVRINADGSISFDKYICKKDFDKDDNLYWTVWTHYNVKYEGGRLNVSEKLIGKAYNWNDDFVKEENNHKPIRKIYYNEKDNW